MKKFIGIGVDLAKNYFQVHALASEGGRAATRKLRRSKMHELFSQIEPCVVGMEACGSAYYWARELLATGHEALPMPPSYNQALCQARQERRRRRGGDLRSDVAPPQSLAAIAPPRNALRAGQERRDPTPMLRKTRELLIEQRTTSVDALRRHLAEFGIVAAKGIGRVDALLELAESDAALPAAARAGVKVLGSRRARQSDRRSRGRNRRRPWAK